MGILVNGRIPAHTECPWRDECRSAEAGVCNHEGKNHQVPFSCGFARGFQMIDVHQTNKLKEFTDLLIQQKKED